MNVDQLVNDALMILLLSIRIGTALAVAPLFSSRSIPGITKVAIAIGLGYMIRGFVAAPHVNLQTPDGELLLVMLGEAMTGAFMGFMVHVLFLTITLAFELAGLTIGFGIARIFDPVNNQDLSILSQFMLSFAVFMFFALNLHHNFISAVILSYKKIPIGGFGLLMGPAIGNLFQFFGMCFEIAVKISLPIMMAILMINLVMGVISKTAPQMNIFFNVAFSINLAVGLVLIIVILPNVRHFFEGVGSELSMRLFGLA